MMAWEIKHIFDGDYGCEELQPGEKAKVSVTLVNEKGETKVLSVEDQWLPDKEKVDQEQASLLNVNDGFRKLIIVGDRYRSGYNEEGILMMSLSDFLLGKENKG